MAGNPSNNNNDNNDDEINVNITEAKPADPIQPGFQQPDSLTEDAPAVEPEPAPPQPPTPSYPPEPSLNGGRWRPRWATNLTMPTALVGPTPGTQALAEPVPEPAQIPTPEPSGMGSPADQVAYDARMGDFASWMREIRGEGSSQNAANNPINDNNDSSRNNDLSPINDNNRNDDNTISFNATNSNNYNNYTTNSDPSEVINFAPKGRRENRVDYAARIKLAKQRLGLITRKEAPPANQDLQHPNAAAGNRDRRAEVSHLRKMDVKDNMYNAQYTARYRADKQKRQEHNRQKKREFLERLRQWQASRGEARERTPELSSDSGDHLYEQLVPTRGRKKIGEILDKTPISEDSRAPPGGFLSKRCMRCARLKKRCSLQDDPRPPCELCRGPKVQAECIEGPPVRARQPRNRAKVLPTTDSYGASTRRCTRCMRMGKRCSLRDHPRKPCDLCAKSKAKPVCIDGPPINTNYTHQPPPSARASVDRDSRSSRASRNAPRKRARSASPEREPAPANKCGNCLTWDRVCDLGRPCQSCIDNNEVLSCNNNLREQNFDAQPQNGPAVGAINVDGQQNLGGTLPGGNYESLIDPSLTAAAGDDDIEMRLFSALSKFNQNYRPPNKQQEAHQQRDQFNRSSNQLFRTTNRGTPQGSMRVEAPSALPQPTTFEEAGFGAENRSTYGTGYVNLAQVHQASNQQTGSSALSELLHRPQQERANAAAGFGQGNQLVDPRAIQNLVRIVGAPPRHPNINTDGSWLVAQDRALRFEWNYTDVAQGLENAVYNPPDALAYYILHDGSYLRPVPKSEPCEEDLTFWAKLVGAQGLPEYCGKKSTNSCEVLVNTPQNRYEAHHFNSCGSCRAIQQGELNNPTFYQIAQELRAYCCQPCADSYISINSQLGGECLCLHVLRNNWLCNQHAMDGWRKVRDAALETREWKRGVAGARDSCPTCFLNGEDRHSGVYICLSCRCIVKDLNQG